MAWRVVFLTMWVPGALSAQVFNYEPYDDSDLLGDFERPKKLHFGMNINVVKPGGASSVFYNGTGFSELGDVFRELISIPERLDWNSVQGGSGNTVRNQIAQSLGIADAGAMTVASYPCLLYTSPSPRDRSLSRMPSSA